MSDSSVRGHRGGSRGGRGGRGGHAVRGFHGSEGGRGGSRGSVRGGRGESRGSFRGAPRERGPSRAELARQERDESHKEGAEKFLKSGRAVRDSERQAKFNEDRKEAKSKARASRVDPRVESITVGTKQVWNESQDESNWCKLSTKFFTTEKIKKLKMTIDCRFKVKSTKYRTDIHFDDITHIEISEDLKTMTIQTRIPTLFEVGLAASDADGAITTDWQEGRNLDWQQPSKNPHPNRYTIVFKEGAFKQDSLALFMNSDSRLKALIQKENAHLSEFGRGAKRTRDEVTPAKEEDKSDKEEGKKDGNAMQTDKTESVAVKDGEKTSKPAQKKQKISEKEAVAKKSEKPVEKKEKGEKKDSPAPSSMDVDAPASGKKKKEDEIKKPSSSKNSANQEKTATEKSKKPVKSEVQSSDSKTSEVAAPAKTEKVEKAKTEKKSVPTAKSESAPTPKKKESAEKTTEPSTKKSKAKKE